MITGTVSVAAVLKDCILSPIAGRIFKPGPGPTPGPEPGPVLLLCTVHVHSTKIGSLKYAAIDWK
jgi:hypothetical protein